LRTKSQEICALPWERLARDSDGSPVHAVSFPTVERVGLLQRADSLCRSEAGAASLSWSGAGAHCQVGAQRLLAARVLDWLDDAFAAG
jgi:hypothetical protein